jgi:hypothetical protein
MRRTTAAAVGVALLLAGLLGGCSARGNAATSGDVLETDAPDPPPEPQISTAEAEAAVSDAMLASSFGLFLAFQAAPGSTSQASDDGSLSLLWDERADFSTGAGFYTIAMNNYSVNQAEVPEGIYNGYVLTGTVVMGSDDGVSTSLQMDLELSHEDPASYPVESIEIRLEGVEDSVSAPDGVILINGEEKAFPDLADSFRPGT